MSDCFCVKPARNPDAKRAAVVFSSRNANGFSFYKLFETFEDDLHRIYVRDPHDLWFDRGTCDEITSWDILERRFREELKELNARDVLTFGASMGGYASLKLASKIDAHSCFAFSPQTLLDRRLPHTPSGDVSEASRDLRLRLDAWQPRNAAIFFGASDFVDIYNVFRVNWQGVDLFPIAGQDHLVVQHLVRSRAVQVMVGDFVAKGAYTAALRLQDKKIALDRYCYDAVQQMLINRIVEGFYLEAGWDVHSNLHALKALRKWADGFHLEAKLLAKSGAFAKAAEAAYEACALSPGSVTLSDTAAEIEFMAGDISAAISGYRRSLTLRAKHYQALCRLGELLASRGEVDEACDMLRQAVEMRPRQVRAQQIAKALDLVL